MADAPVPATAPSPLVDNLCWLLSRASQVLTAELTAALADLGLAPRAHMVLLAAESGPYSQTEIARMVGLDKTTMVVTMDELEAAGLAERRPSPTDRRARVIVVTRKGTRLLRKADAIFDAIRGDVLTALPDDQRDVFVDALRGLVGDRLSGTR
ncbi:MAG TPA: MarR family transcriptional regulator [Baekduia sp.]|nr:MarR family transcriptional regulator [Baekduia sp.]